MKIEKEFMLLKNYEKASNYSRFFKTGMGDYGYGDLFLGIAVPEVRKIAKKYIDLDYLDLKKLICSKYHELRLAALIILTSKFYSEPKKVYNFYFDNINFINNWDLVDLSAPNIFGKYLFNNERSILYDLAKSENLWEKRIAIISTFYFIRKNQFYDTLKISEILINDKHDLIHKAVGWMLREIGKRDIKTEEKFLLKYYKIMPRTMLRYAIEKFDKEKRNFYMN